MRVVGKSERTVAKVLYVTHDIGFFISHRLPIALAARSNGYEVKIVGPLDEHCARLRENGLQHVTLSVPRGLMNPLGQLRSVTALARIFRRERPDLVHLIASKPVIVGGFIARIMKIPSISAISGLGHIFIDDSFSGRLKQRLVMFAYRLALAHRLNTVIFQNEDHRSLFVRNGVDRHRTELIRGSGTDTDCFNPEPSDNQIPVVLMPARMLWTKGVREFCEAAARLRRSGRPARFVMVGSPYLGNPASLTSSELDEITAAGDVEWRGHTSDISAEMHESDIIVLPSYSEGLPKTLVDAAAAGRATVTTDVPGCRDAIEPGVTGLLARSRDSADLADKIAALLDSPELRLSMGRDGRALALREFSIDRIVLQHMDIYRHVLGPSLRS